MAFYSALERVLLFLLSIAAILVVAFITLNPKTELPWQRGPVAQVQPDDERRCFTAQHLLEMCSAVPEKFQI